MGDSGVVKPCGRIKVQIDRQDLRFGPGCRADEPDWRETQGMAATGSESAVEQGHN